MNNKENLLKLGKIQNHIQLMKQLNRAYSFNTLNRKKLSQLEKEVKALYKEILKDKLEVRK